MIVPEGKWRKVSPTSLSLSLPDANYQCIHRTSVSSLSAKESSFTSEEPLVSGEGHGFVPCSAWYWVITSIKVCASILCSRAGEFCLAD